MTSIATTALWSGALLAALAGTLYAGVLRGSQVGWGRETLSACVLWAVSAYLLALGMTLVVVMFS